jgi:hypothetical protein
MPNILKQWKVLPHGKLTQVDDGLLTVTGDIRMPLVDFVRRMTVVRLRDGRLVVYSAFALDEDEMQALDDFGSMAFLVVPGDHHRRDVGVWKTRYPDIQVVAPPGARDKVEEIVAVDTDHDAFEDPGVDLVTVPGTDGHEAALVVKRAAGTTIVVNDLIANMEKPGGFGGWLLARMGYAGDEPQIPAFARRKLIDDVDALAAQLRQWADDHRLIRILPSHGAPIENDPAGTLRRLAESLAIKS